MAARKVFISYRSVDRERVRVVAEALMAADIEVWWDQWEILPGDNFVTRINEGLTAYDCGIVFLSNESIQSGWQWEEITVLKDMYVDQKKPLIPIVLDEHVKVPPLLKVHSRLRADQVPQLVDAIHGRTGKPERKQAAVSSRVRFSIRLRDLAGGEIGVSAGLDGKALIAEIRVRPDSAFRFSYSDFLQQVASSRMGGAAEIAAARSRELLNLGDAIEQVVFAGGISGELAAQVSGNQEVELIYETESPGLLSIPCD